MDTGGSCAADGDEPFRSADGFITADGLRFWNTVIAAGALVAACGRLLGACLVMATLP